jgi:hypothetical protein
VSHRVVSHRVEQEQSRWARAVALSKSRWLCEPSGGNWLTLLLWCDCNTLWAIALWASLRYEQEQSCCEREQIRCEPPRLWATYVVSRRVYAVAFTPSRVPNVCQSAMNKSEYVVSSYSEEYLLNTPIPGLQWQWGPSITSCSIPSVRVRPPPSLYAPRLHWMQECSYVLLWLHYVALQHYIHYVALQSLQPLQHYVAVQWQSPHTIVNSRAA